MKPKIIPWKQVIILSLLLAITITISFIDGEAISESLIPGGDTPDDNNTKIDTDPDSGRFGVESADTLSGFSGTSMRVLVINIISIIILAIFGILAFSSSYVYALNSDSLQDYVNTALKLAGFETMMPKIGKSMILSPGVFFSLNRDKVMITLPKYEDPRIFGFRPTNGTAIAYCNLNKFQLKLQIIRDYLDAYA